MRRLALLLTVCCTLALTWTPLRAAVPAGTIAYLRSSAGSSLISGKEEIRLIEPDGTQDRHLWSVDTQTVLGIDSLSWSPDATALAFSSGHEDVHSLYESDIYTVQPDGSHLKRITNGPDYSALDSYPKGRVTVTVNVASDPNVALYVIYLAGASDAQIATAGTHTLTFDNVADFGPDRGQGFVAINGLHRTFGSIAVVDVQAGKTVDAGILNISELGTQNFGAYLPVWRADGSRIGFKGPGDAFLQIAATPPENDLGESLIKPDTGLAFQSLFDWSPLPDQASQLLYAVTDYGAGQIRIYRTTEGSNDIGTEVTSFEAGQILDLKWLPDGSGFLYVVTSDFDSTSNIFEYDFATQQTHQITHFSNEVAGHLSISPDGQAIVFEHAADLQTPNVDLWMVNRSGDNPHLFLANASRPAWSRVAPHVPAATSYSEYLPYIKR